MSTTDQHAHTRLGPYVLAEMIGRGGAATVYRAQQPSLGRDVAIKVLRRDADPQFAARFGREARAIAALQHPNILPVYDFGEQGDLQYLVMRYVEGGRTLREELERGPIAPAAALRLMARLLEALGHAHARGVVHRDIKPGNVLLPEPGWPLLADFGIARFGGDTRQLTLAGQAIGTPDYMSPEQASGRLTDARSDLYSAGVLLYEMLTGRVPFQGESALAVVMQHVGAEPPPPRSLNPRLPAAVEPPLLRALAKDPADRFQSAAEMAAALERVAAALDAPAPSAPPVGAPAPAQGPRPAQPSGGRRLPLLAGLALLLAAGAALALAGRGAGRPEPPGTPAPAAAETRSLPVRLDDDSWEGGYRRADGSRDYGGRTAAWIYGTSTPYNTMRASFELGAPPECAALLVIEGMDSEGAAKTPIRVAVNGAEVYRGPNPLPDDDVPLESGTWAAHAFPIDSAALRAGRNDVEVSNLAEGAFSLPPFFMLDYAEVICR